MHAAEANYDRARRFFNLAARFFFPIRPLAAAALALCHLGPALASPICEPWETLRQRLESPKYNERIRGQGIAPNGSALFLFAASDGGRGFSLVYRPPKGDACLIAAGENWEQIERIELPVIENDPPAAGG